MRSGKNVSNHDLDFFEFLPFPEQVKEGGAQRPDLFFFTPEVEEKELLQKRISHYLRSYPAARRELLAEYSLEKKLFWLFIEYFIVRRGVSLKELLARVERNIIINTLSKVNGNQKRASVLLGLKHTTLNEKIKKYNIRFK